MVERRVEESLPVDSALRLLCRERRPLGIWMRSRRRGLRVGSLGLRVGGFSVSLSGFGRLPLSLYWRRRRFRGSSRRLRGVCSPGSTAKGSVRSLDGSRGGWTCSSVWLEWSTRQLGKEKTHVIVLSFQWTGVESSDLKVREEGPNIVPHLDTPLG